MAYRKQFIAAAMGLIMYAVLTSTAYADIPWTPAFAPLARWYDAADSSTITESGGAVSQWDDKSRNGQDLAQGTPSDQPTLVGNYIQFDGTNDIMIGAKIVATNITVFGVVRTYTDNGVTDANKSWMCHFGGTANPDWAMTARTDVDQLGVLTVDASLDWESVSTAATRDQNHIVVLSSADAGVAKAQVRVDGGTAALTANQQADVLQVGGSAELRVGCQKPGWPDRFHLGRIYEIIIIDQRLTEADPDFLKIEGYLAHKWGLTNSLPAGHPYKSAAPVIPTYDNAWVKKDVPNDDMSEAETILLKSNGDNGLSRLTYLRFDISDLQSTDTVFLDMNLSSLSASADSDPRQLDVWLLNDGIAETTWDSHMTWNTRPDGTASLPNGNVTAVGSVAYVAAGNISIPIASNVLQTIISGDSNGHITLILSNNSGNSGGIAQLSSISNTGGYLTPQLRVLSGDRFVTIPESTHGGRLMETSETTYSYWNTTATPAVGEGGSGNADEQIQMLLFELPRQPTGGFEDADTSFRIIVSAEDVVNLGQHADLWGIGYVPAEDVGNVGTSLNNGGVTDIDDFFLSEANSETKTGWNMTAANTVKIWNDMAGRDSANTLASPPSANIALTSFVNSLFNNHGAEAGDYLVLRVNYDVNMTDYDNWNFYSGNAAATNKPLLTLSAITQFGTIFRFH